MMRLAIACALLALLACAPPPAAAQATPKCVVPINFNGPVTINYVTKFIGFAVFSGTMTSNIDASGVGLLFDAPAGNTGCNFSALTPALKASLASTALFGTVSSRPWTVATSSMTADAPAIGMSASFPGLGENAFTMTGKTAMVSITGKAANNVPLSYAVGDLDMTGQAWALNVKAPGGYWKLKLELAIKDGLSTLLTGCTSGLGQLAATWPVATVLDCSKPLTVTYTEPLTLTRLGLKTVVKFASRAVYEARMTEATIFVPPPILK